MINLNVIASIAATIALYLLFHHFYKKFPTPLLHPNIVATFVLILALHFLDIPFQDYNEGGQYITSLLGICIVVLAIPMYETLDKLMKNFGLILLTSLVSIYISFLSVFYFSKLLGIPKDILLSMVPKSITTAMAIEASHLIPDSTTAITVMAVMITGVSGAIIGRTLLNIFRILDPIARGCALGMGAHVMGTSQALEEGAVTGSFSAMSIPVTGILTILNLPVFVFLIDRLY